MRVTKWYYKETLMVSNFDYPKFIFNLISSFYLCARKHTTKTPTMTIPYSVQLQDYLWKFYSNTWAATLIILRNRNRTFFNIIFAYSEYLSPNAKEVILSFMFHYLLLILIRHGGAKNNFIKCIWTPANILWLCFLRQCIHTQD